MTPLLSLTKNSRKTAVYNRKDGLGCRSRVEMRRQICFFAMNIAGGIPRLEFGTFGSQGAYGNDGTRCSQPACRHDLFRCTVTTILSWFRDSIGLHLAPSPSARDWWSAAGAVKYVPFRKACNRGYDTRPIAKGTKGHQVSSEALRTFHTMANTVPHYNASHENWRGHWALTGTARKAGESPVVELEAPPTISPDELISLA